MGYTPVFDCDVNLMVRIMEVTCDLRPLHWLVARFVPSEQDRRTAAVDELQHMLPRLAELLAAAGGDQRSATPKRVRR